MTAPKTIAIVGATGTQGSSVARTFLSLPNWHVRCLTRDPSSEKALELARLGGELVQANLDNKDSLHRAFKGVHAIFLNTDFWLPYRAALASGADALTSAKQGYEAEITHGKNAANVAATIPTLEKLIYSALGPMKAASGGKYSLSYHWETKAYLVDYIEKIPELAKKASFVYIGAYISNPFLYPKYQPESKELIYILPASKSMRMPIIDTATSTGPFMMDVWARVTGKTAKLIQMSVQDIHEKFGIPLEVLGGPAFIDEFGYCAGVQNIIELAQLKSHVQAKGFEEWLKGQDIMALLGLKDSNQWDGLVQ